MCVGFCAWCWFYGAVLSVNYLTEEETAGCFTLCSICGAAIVILCQLLAVAWVGLQCVIVALLGHTRPPDKNFYWKIIVFISYPKHMLWVLKRTVSTRRFF